MLKIMDGSALLYALKLKNFDVARYYFEKGADVLVPCGAYFDSKTGVLEWVSKKSSLILILPTVLSGYSGAGGDWLHGNENPIAYAVSGGNLDQGAILKG